MKVLSTLVFFTLLATSTAVRAEQCAQPLTSGAAPTATDCLFILRVAVNATTCSPECICAPSGTLPVTATDALLCLKAAVGTPTSLECPCEPTTTLTTVTSTTMTTLTTTTTTLASSAPRVATLAATSVGSTNAVLNGEVNPNGLPTEAWFEWGTSPNLDTFDKTFSEALGNGGDSLPVTATLSALSSEVTYYYRVAASNVSGPSSGSITSFTTAPVDPFGVVSTSPLDAATDVPVETLVTITFNRDVEPATLVDAITMSSSTVSVAGTISYDFATKTAIFTPGAPLEPLTDYDVRVDDKVKSVDTVRLSEPYLFSFATAAAF
jgi:hypothetical protein